MKVRLLIFALFSIISFTATGQESLVNLKVYLDCRSCDQDYLSQNMTYISFVRDQKNADIHIMIRSQKTGIGGVSYEIEFWGQQVFSRLFNKITFSTKPTNTPTEVRDTIRDNLETGLVLFYVQQNKNHRDWLIQNKDNATVTKDTTPVVEKDRWNKWVFNFGVNGRLSGEETSETSNLGVDFSAKRVTEKNKFSFRGSFNRDKSKFTFGDTKILANNRTSEIFVSNVFSIGKLWSLGVFAEAGASDYTNLSFYGSLKPAIEYSFFPYKISTKKQLTLSYRIGGIQNTYKERTIFLKEKEFLWEHEINLNGSIQQKWGSFSGEISYNSFLKDTSLHAFNFNLASSVRLFKGFSFNVYGNYAITNNQINLAGGNLSLDELLLRQQQVGSGYRFSMSLGLSYSFGSIYSAIVNPRFGF